MTYSVMDVSRYVINRCIDMEKAISNLKLQKILYYIQAAFLIEKGEPCFQEQFTKWRHGPVQERVYHYYKKYFGKDIWEKQTKYTEVVFGGDAIMKIVEKEFKEEIISKADRRLMDEVINAYKDIGAWTLVDKTHAEDPWMLTETNEPIDIGLIKNYYSIYRSKVYGVQ